MSNKRRRDGETFQAKSNAGKSITVREIITELETTAIGASVRTWGHPMSEFRTAGRLLTPNSARTAFTDLRDGVVYRRI